MVSLLFDQAFFLHLQNSVYFLTKDVSRDCYQELFHPLLQPYNIWLVFYFSKKGFSLVSLAHQLILHQLWKKWVDVQSFDTVFAMNQEFQKFFLS